MQKNQIFHGVVGREADSRSDSKVRSNAVILGRLKKIYYT
jgi:hypothetical protein